MPRQSLLIELFHERIRIKFFYIVYTRTLPFAFEEHHGTDHSRNTGGVADSLHTCFLVSFLMAAVVVDIVSTFFSVFDATDTATDRGFTFIVLT